MSKLNEAADNINKGAGKRIAFLGKDFDGQEFEVVSTGLSSLDYAIGPGGLPRGRVIEMHGLQSSGKSSLCLSIISNFQKLGLSCAYLDAEYAFNFDHARQLGVDTDNLLFVQPDCGEEGFEAIEKLVREKTDLIVVDSVSGLVPRSELEAETGKPQMGGQARLVSQGLRKLTALIAKNKTIVIFINQLRMNIMGGQWDPYISTGGMALKFYSSVMLELKKRQALMLEDKIQGIVIEIRVTKNKVGRPLGSCQVQLLFEGGFKGEADLLTLAEEKGVVTRRGKTYYFNDIKLGVGAGRSRQFIAEHADIEALIKENIK